MIESRTRRAFLQAMSGLYGAAASKAACPSGIPDAHLKHLPTGKPTPLAPEPAVQDRPLLSSPEGKAQLPALMRAYDELACRDPLKDPTSLSYQMSLHALNCTRGPRNVHGSWAFLPWHRGFLYFHERILRRLLGDSFRLPVWDWEKNDRVPDPYGVWAAAKLNRHAHEDLAGKANACALQAWLFSESYESFAGYAPNTMIGGHAPAGMAPGGPHSLAHGIVGGTFGPPRTAAADPIFYAHHANVDRFWIHWRNAHPEFRIPHGFCDQVFAFYDENGHLRFVRAGDLLDEKRLGYRYEEPRGITVLSATNLLVGRQIPDAGSAIRFFTDVIQKLEPAARNPMLALAFLEKALHRAAGIAADLKLPFNIRWHPEQARVMPGVYYLIAIRPVGLDMKTVAGFGVFGMHSQAPIVATGCFELSDFALLLRPGSQLVYGKADGNGIQPEDPQPVWPAFVNVLRS
jgi:hypothetical protein